MPVRKSTLPDSKTLRGRILKTMIDEGGCWTANGIADLVKQDPVKISEVMSGLRSRGFLKVVGSRKRTEGRAGRPEKIYEVVSEYVAAYLGNHRA